MTKLVCNKTSGWTKLPISEFLCFGTLDEETLLREGRETVDFGTIYRLTEGRVCSTEPV